MRKFTFAAILAATVFVSASHAAVITNREDLNRVPSLTMVTFTEIKLDATKAVSDLGQPYKPLGLVLPNQTIDPEAGLPGAPGNAAAVSTHIDAAANATVQTFVFVHPQKALGFNVRDRKAISIVVTAFDPSGNTVESTTLKSSGDPQYVGFLRKNQDMVRVVIRAPHKSASDAKSSPLEIADVTFATPSLPGETSMLTPAGGGRSDIDADGIFGDDHIFAGGGTLGGGNNLAGAGNLLAYGGDANGTAPAGNSSATHSNQQRGVPISPAVDDPTTFDSTDTTGIDHPAPLLTDSSTPTGQPAAPPALNAVVQFPEPALMSLVLVPIVAFGFRRRKPKPQ
jgi:hypothetical protein